MGQRHGMDREEAQNLQQTNMVDIPQPVQARKSNRQPSSRRHHRARSCGQAPSTRPLYDRRHRLSWGRRRMRGAEPARRQESEPPTKDRTEAGGGPAMRGVSLRRLVSRVPRPESTLEPTRLQHAKDPAAFSDRRADKRDSEPASRRLRYARRAARRARRACLGAEVLGARKREALSMRRRHQRPHAPGRGRRPPQQGPRADWLGRLGLQGTRAVCPAANSFMPLLKQDKRLMNCNAWPRRHSESLAGRRAATPRLSHASKAPVTAVKAAPVTAVKGAPVMAVKGAPATAVKGAPVMAVKGAPATAVKAARARAVKGARARAWA